MENYSELFESIGETIEDDTQLDYEFELFSQNQKDFNQKLVVLAEFIKKQEHPVENMSTKIVGAKGQLKLPKFEIKKFDGKNPIEWTSFYDSFNKVINKNSSLSNVEKINYVLNLVTDDALATIKGLLLSNSSY